MLILFLLFAADTNAPLTLAPVPEDLDAYLQDPYDMDMDAQGRFYLVDAVAGYVFVWEADGSFKGLIGSPGDGPGEFRFNAAGEPQAWLGVVNETLLVFDGGKRAIHRFTLDGVYQGTDRLSLAGGRTRGFYFTAQGNYILDHHHYLKEPETFELWQLDREGKHVKTLHQQLDKSSEDITSGGRQTGALIKAYAPQTATAWHRERGELLLGYGDAPVFQVLSSQGKRLKQIRVPLLQAEVTTEDKERYKSIPWLQNPFFKLRFPDKKAFFTGLAHLGDRGYLIYSQEPVINQITGLHVDTEGKVVKRINFTLGENGTLINVRGRLMAVTTDEDGVFAISERHF